MSKQFLAVLIAVIIIFVGIFAITNHNKSGGSGAGTGATTSHVEGQGKDDVSLVEYGDYECPYCGEYYSTVKQIAAEYNTQITFQFVNFPLESIHPNAFAGARAAEAANEQGKFWQMHDLLYEENQIYYDSNEEPGTWVGASTPLTFFDKYAKQLGLNVTEFNTDYNSNKVNDLINNDLDKGNKLSVQATPTFYLDGKHVSPGNSVAEFQSLINAAIKQKTSATATSSTNKS